MKAISTWRYVFLAVPLVWIMLQIVEAGVVTIWPHEFGQTYHWLLSSAESEYRFQRSGYFIRGVGTNSCYLFAPVDLAVGKRVTKLKLYALGQDESASTFANIVRIKMGQQPESMAVVWAEGESGLRAETETTINSAEVKRNYLYFVEIFVRNEYSYIYGVKVYYR
jgi:hypothetical protein